VLLRTAAHAVQRAFNAISDGRDFNAGVGAKDGDGFDALFWRK